MWLYLSNIATSVTLIHRRDSLRSEKILQDQLNAKTKNGNINIIWNHTLDEVLGDGTKVSGIRIRDVKTDATQTLNLDGVFIAIGHDPNTALFKDKLTLKNGYIVIMANGNEYAIEVQC